MKLPFLAVLAIATAGAAPPSVIGTWDCVAIAASGSQTRWSLAVRQDGGKLAATLRAPDGYTLDLIEPQIEDSRFSFRFQVGSGESIEVLLAIDGDYMEGRFGGATSGAGVFRARRASAPDASGTWTGEWEIDPAGQRGTPHHMALTREGHVVTGTAGPSPGRQLPIANGKLSGNLLTFDLAVPYGPTLVFEFTVAGDTMVGAATLSGRKLKLTAKRAAQ